MTEAEKHSSLSPSANTVPNLLKHEAKGTQGEEIIMY